VNGVEVATAVKGMQAQLAELLVHEHASLALALALALAQQASGVTAPAPLFATLFNYRHATDGDAAVTADPPGMQYLRGEERTNYPLAVSVDDFGSGFGFAVQAMAPDRSGGGRYDDAGRGGIGGHRS
jgi:hypothetical protein